jgi:hypothetical protein
MKLKSTGSKRTASGGGSKGSNVLSVASRVKRSYPFFAICIEADEDGVSLQIGKAYRVIRPESNNPTYFMRVIDEEGQDYLYPAEWFVPIDLPPKAKKALVAAGV